MRADAATPRAWQIGPSSNGRKTGHKIMSNSMLALGRLHDSNTRAALQTPIPIPIPNPS